MNEQWMKWEPVKGLSTKYYLNSVTDNDDAGFKIELVEFENRKKKATFLFSDWVYSYRYIEEIFALNKINFLKKKYGENFLNWTFFKVTNSQYIQWLSQESHTISDNRQLQHFSFRTMDSVLDVINDSDPIVEFFEGK